MENVKKSYLIDLDEDIVTVQAQFICCKLRETDIDEQGRKQLSFYRCFQTSKVIDLSKFLLSTKNSFIEGSLDIDFIPEPNKLYTVGLKIPRYTITNNGGFAQVTPKLAFIKF